MKSLKTYSIPFTGLKLGKHQFDFEITDEFFNQFEYSLVKKGKLNCRIELEKQETMLILNFDISGTIDLSCDRCLADYPQQVNITEQQIAKFSDEELNDNEEIVILTKNDHEINVAGLIYEYINVAVPFITVCSEEGRTEYCDNDMLERIDKLSGNEEQQNNEEADPRWDALKKLNK
ncbi:YceD family protein [Mucilaginibacter sp. AW1-3]